MEARERESIQRDLASADDELRRLAVERLDLLPAREAIPELVARLGDPSWRVRKAAVERLAASSEPELACDGLLAALADGDNPGRRNAALETLVRFGGVAVEALLAATASSDADVRKQAVDALAGIADPRSAPRLAELLADSDPNVRGAAAEALGAIARPESASLVLRAMREDPERLVRLSALCALTRMEWPVAVSELGGVLQDSLLRPAALALLGWSEDPAAPALLLEMFASGTRAASEAAMQALFQRIRRLPSADAERLAERVREQALAAPEAVERALARLDDADLPTRLTLVQFLGVLRSERVVLPLLRAARDEALSELVLSVLADFGPLAEVVLDAAFDKLDADERALACEAFGNATSAGSRRRLLEALVDTDPLLRAGAVRALTRRRDPQALESLVRRFEAEAESEDEESGEQLELLAEAILAIATPGSSAGAHAGGMLSERLAEASEGYRSAAARVLGQLGGRENAERLALLFSDPSAKVRRAAVEGLARQGDGALPEALHLACADEAPAVRIAAAGALGASADPGALEDLERLAGDPHAAVRGAALRAAGALRLAEPGDLARRLALLERGVEEGGPAAIAALEVLGALGDPRAVATAQGAVAADAPELVRAALSCLGRIAAPSELEALLPLLEHPSWAVRAELIRVLAERGVPRAVPALLGRLEGERDDFVRQALLQALERLER